LVMFTQRPDRELEDWVVIDDDKPSDVPTASAPRADQLPLSPIPSGQPIVKKSYADVARSSVAQGDSPPLRGFAVDVAPRSGACHQGQEQEQEPENEHEHDHVHEHGNGLELGLEAAPVGPSSPLDLEGAPKSSPPKPQQQAKEKVDLRKGWFCVKKPGSESKSADC